MATEMRPKGLKNHEVARVINRARDVVRESMVPDPGGTFRWSMQHGSVRTALAAAIIDSLRSQDLLIDEPFREPEPEKPARRRCMGHRCTNHSDEGRGLEVTISGVSSWICTPCHQYLTRGEGRRPQPSRNAVVVMPESGEVG